MKDASGACAQPNDCAHASLRVCGGKNRLIQLASGGGRKLFNNERREIFLEWFAATCNVKLAADKAGIGYQTVFKHRAKDVAFAEAWDRALEQGYARLEARLLQSIEITDRIGEGEVEEMFDKDLAVLLLREYSRRGANNYKSLRTNPRSATTNEVAEALTKRLRAFSLRVQGRVDATND